MKTHMKKISTFLLLPFFLTGCFGVDDIIDQPVDSSQLNLGATIDNYATRTGIGPSDSIVWKQTDSISVLARAGFPANVCFRLTKGASTPNAIFTGTRFDVSGGYWALYPYSESAVLDGGNISIQLENGVQTAVNGGFDPAFALLAGHSMADFVFMMNVMAFVKVSIDFPCSQIVVESGGGRTINASSIVIGSDVNGMLSINSIKAAKENPGKVTLKAANGSIQPGTYMIAILPVTLDKGYTVSFKTSAESYKDIVKKSSAKSIDLACGDIIDLGTVSASDFTPASHPNNLWLGDGTAEYPYLITSEGQLNDLAAQVNAGYFNFSNFLMTKDIDKHGGTVGIGAERPFSGTFDGAGHTIGNIRFGEFNSSSMYYSGRLSVMGIFPVVQNATVRNLHVVYQNSDANMDITSDYPDRIIGGIVGYAYSDADKYTTVTGCSFTVCGRRADDGDILISGNHDVIWGGIIGLNLGNLRCNRNVSDVNVKIYSDESSNSSPKYFGGIVGYVQSGIGSDTRVYMDRCRNLGSAEIKGLKTNVAMAGGMIGYVYEHFGSNNVRLKMTNCVNSGSIAANCAKGNETEAYSGGLIGKHDSDGSAGEDPYIVNCLNKSEISATAEESWAGGLMGWCYDDDTQIVNCANAGAVKGATHTGQSCGNGKGHYTNFASGVNVSPLVFNATRPESGYEVTMAEWIGTGSDDVDLNF